jgi:hypothetical protein
VYSGVPAELGVRVSVTPSACGHEQAMSLGRVVHAELAAAHSEDIAVAPGGRARFGRHRLGRLADCGAEYAAVADLGQQRLLLVAVAECDNRQYAEGEGRQCRHRQGLAADCGEDDGDLDRAEAVAAERHRQGQGEQARLGHRLPQRLVVAELTAEGLGHPRVLGLAGQHGAGELGHRRLLVIVDEIHQIPRISDRTCSSISHSGWHGKAEAMP